jgi:Uma2 family endonuclease
MQYELVRGELFVTPTPTGQHESILAALSARVTPCVVANGLGLVYHPRAVLRLEHSEVEPDLMVRRPWGRADTDWAAAPLPSLIVEVLSPSSSSIRTDERRGRRAVIR